MCRWSKREEQDFARVIGFFGVEFNKKTNRYDWTKFRQLANLNKKSDERLTLYLHDFRQMCWRVLKKKNIRQGVEMGVVWCHALGVHMYGGFNCVCALNGDICSPDLKVSFLLFFSRSVRVEGRSHL